MEKNLKLLRLYDLPKGAEIHGMDVKIDVHKNMRPVIIQFDHVDGMYSYNYVLDMKGKNLLNKDNSKAIIHLANTSILKIVGDHYEMAKEDEAKNFKD